jgi:hypothetical protein
VERDHHGVAASGWIDRSGWKSILLPRKLSSLRDSRARRVRVRWILLYRTTLTLDAEWALGGAPKYLGRLGAAPGTSPRSRTATTSPDAPRLAETPFAYHYLTSVTVAAMVALGMSPIAALPLHSFVLSVFVALAVYAFAKRLTGGSGPAALTVVLFLLGGGLGWTLTLRGMLQSHGAWETLMRQPWDAVLQQKENFRWLNVFFSLIYPQRSFLYGLPIGLLVLTILLNAVR